MTSKPAQVGNSKKRDKINYYPTPYSMTEQLFEKEKFIGNVLEPACGDGHMSKIISKYNTVYSSDIYFPVNPDNIFNKAISKGLPFNRFDFLKYEHGGELIEIDNIITNPPFHIAYEFIMKAKQIAKNKIAMLLPIAYLHGYQRYVNLWQDENFPLLKVFIFVRRPMLLKNSIRDDGKYETGMQTFAWYIWNKEYDKNKVPFTIKPMLDWIDNNKYVLTNTPTVKTEIDRGQLIFE